MAYLSQCELEYLDYCKSLLIIAMRLRHSSEYKGSLATLTPQTQVKVAVTVGSQVMYGNQHTISKPKSTDMIVVE